MRWSPAVLCWFSANAAWGQAIAPSDERIVVELTFEGFGCADGSQLEALVRQRSRRIEFASSSSRRVEVEVSAPDGARPWQARLHFEERGRASQQRELEADECSELVNAAAFVIALTLDPPMGASPETEPTSEIPETTAEPPAGAPEQEQPTPPPDPRGSRADDASPVSLDSPSDAGFHTTVGLHAALAHAVAPEPLLGGGVSVSLLWLDDSSIWDPTLRLSVDYVAGAGFTAAGGEASFRLAGGTLELCPVLLGDVRFGVRPCAMFTAGAVSASGSFTPLNETHTRPWGVLGGALVAHGALSPGLVAELSLGLGATLVRDTYQFEPVVLHEVGPLAARGTFGIGLVLP